MEQQQEGRRSNNNNNKKRKEQCLTMHQPWASLLVHGIKRIEGRSWPSPLTGRLWIHAASKVPDRETVKTMEEFYREIYARDGITDLEFPQNYPVSKLIGCIEVVGCVRRKELACWKEVPEGVRLEALTDFCWLCEHPQKLSVPIQMGGWKGVYDLDSKINEASIGSLIRIESPLPLKFTLPNPEDPSSLRPDSLSPHVLVPEIEKSPKLSAIIDAASQAATQFSNRGQNNNAPRAATTHFSNKGQNTNSNDFYSRNHGNITRSEDVGFVRKNQSTTHFSNMGQNTNSNGFYSRNNGNTRIPEDVGFVRNNQYNGNYRFENRNQRNSYRPTATQYVRKEQNMGSNDNRSTPQINEAATQLSTKGESSRSNGGDSSDNGNFTRPKDARFLRNNLDNRNQSYSSRPAAAQYMKKEQNNGLHNVNQRDLYTSTSTQFVRSDRRSD